MAIQKGNSRTWNMSTDVDANSNKITNLADPTSAQDASTKNYVDTEIAGVGGTDLSYVAATRTLESSTGNDVVLPEATTTDAGLLSSDDKVLLNTNPLQGFESLTDSTLSFDNGTRTVTLTYVSDWSYWVNGTRYTKTGNETCVIPNTEGTHFIYFNGASMTSTTTFNYDIINTYAFVAEVYWDATNAKQILLADERHGINMDNTTHAYLHATQGAQLASGGALGDIVADGDGSSDTHVQFSNEATVMHDEDIKFSHSARTSTATLPIYYRSGADASSIWRVNEAGNVGVLTTGTGRGAYNLLSGGTWSQAEVTNQKFFLMHAFVSNDPDRPYALIQGQNQYDTISEARAGAESEINTVILDGLPTLEFVFVGTIIFQTRDTYTNSVKSRIRTTTDGGDYIDLRGVVITRSGVSTAVYDHTLLANIGTNTHDQIDTALADAVYESDTATTGFGFVIDEDNMASNLDTKVPTQQSTKAYADTKMGQNGGAHWDANSLKIQNVATPTAGGDAVNKTYADSVGGATNLTWTAATSTVASDTGTDATLTVVDATNPGLMTVADKSKLDGIEASADVTDSTNVDAAGAVMNSDTSTAAMSFVIDEDTMASNLDTKVPTQQSVKAYADSITGTTNLSYTAASGNGTVTSDTGTNATIPAATVTNAGLFLPAEKTKLTNIETLADVTDTANVSTTGAGARAHGYATMSGGTPTLASNSLNISSITDVDVGKIRFNFSAGLGLTTDAYTVAVSLDTGGTLRVPIVAEQNSSYVEVWVRDGTGTLSDSYNGVSVVIFSNH